MLYSVAEGIGIAMKLKDRRSGVRIPVGASDFFFPPQNFQTGTVARPAPYATGTGVLSRG
jgi:hypothetical protein